MPTATKLHRGTHAKPAVDDPAAIAPVPEESGDSQEVIRTNDATITLYVCRHPSSGQFYSSFEVLWFHKAKFPQRHSMLVPSKNKKFATRDDARTAALQDARDYVGHLYEQHLEKDQLQVLHDAAAAIQQARIPQPATDSVPSVPLCLEDPGSQRETPGHGLGRSASRPRKSAANASSRVAPQGAETVSRSGDRATTVAADETQAAADTIDLAGWDQTLLSWSQSKERVVEWPIDKITWHPDLRPVDPAWAARVKERIVIDGQQRVAVILRVPPHSAGIPEGHAQGLDGRHRCQAVQDLGQDTVLAVIRGDCHDREALEIIGRQTEDARPWNDVEKAKLLRSMHAAGRTWQECATDVGLQTAQAAINLAKLADAPEIWQQRLVSGETSVGGPKSKDKLPIHQATVREIAKYAHVPVVLEALEQDLRVKNRYQRILASEDRDNQVDEVQRLAGKATRSLTTANSKRLQYSWEVQHCDDCLFDWRPHLDALAVVEMPNWDGKIEQRATNVKLWDQLQAAAAKELIAKIDSRQAGRKSKSSTKKSPAVLASEKKERDRKQREQFTKNLKAWRLRFLRYLIAEQLQPGDCRVAIALPAVMAVARDRQNEYRSESAPLEDFATAAAIVQAARHDRYTPPLGRISDPLDWIKVCYQDGREDEVTVAAELQCGLLKLLLWPQTDVPYAAEACDLVGSKLPMDWKSMPWKQRQKVQPLFLLDIDDGQIEVLAALWKINLAVGWKAGGQHGSAARDLVREYFDLHSREQLDALAKEICGLSAFGPERRAKHGSGTAAADVATAKTKSDAIDTLLGYHTAAAPLRLPAALAGKGKPAASKKKK